MGNLKAAQLVHDV